MTQNELQPPGGWISTTAPRMEIPSAADQGLLFRTLGRFGRRFGRDQVPHVFTALHQHPGLFWGWLYFASRLMPYGKLATRTRELIILRVGWNCRCRYEWGQHVQVALQACVTDADIAAVANGADGFSNPQDQAVMRACDELQQNQLISDTTWALLQEFFDNKRIIEISMLAGHYVMLAGFLNSAGLQLEPSIEDELADFNQRIQT